MSPKANTKNCLFTSAKIAIEDFKREGDGRQWRVKAQNRWILYTRIAGYANPDGTNAWPSVKTLMKLTGWSHGKVCYVLTELKEMGVVVNTGHRHNRRGPTIRKLTPPEVANQTEGVSQSPKPDSESSLTIQDSTTLTVQPSIHTVQSSTDTVQSSSSYSPIQVGHDLPVVDLPVVDLPSLPALVRKADLMEGMGRIFVEADKGILSRVGADKVEKLADRDGAEQVLQVFKWWLTNRPGGFEGLNHPLLKFIEEYPEAAAGFRKQPKVPTPDEIAAMIASYNQRRDVELAQIIAAKQEENQPMSMDI